MVLSNVSGLETRVIPTQIGRDHRQFLAIAELIFADFRAAAGYESLDNERPKRVS
jgi:hypothetical protein